VFDIFLNYCIFIFETSFGLYIQRLIQNKRLICKYQRISTGNPAVMEEKDETESGCNLNMMMNVDIPSV